MQDCEFSRPLRQFQANPQHIRRLQIAEDDNNEVTFRIEAVVSEEAIDATDMIDQFALRLGGEKPAVAIPQVGVEQAASGAGWRAGNMDSKHVIEALLRYQCVTK